MLVGRGEELLDRPRAGRDLDPAWATAARHILVTQRRTENLLHDIGMAEAHRRDAAIGIGNRNHGIGGAEIDTDSTRTGGTRTGGTRTARRGRKNARAHV